MPRASHQRRRYREWDFRGGRIFVTVGSYEDEFDPNRGHGWMCRLVDSGALGIAGFARVRRHELEIPGKSTQIGYCDVLALLTKGCPRRGRYW